MAASRRVSPAAARTSATRSAPRARGRRRRPSLWRRLLVALPRPAHRVTVDPVTALQHEVHELRLAVAALKAEVAQLRERPPMTVTPESAPVSAPASSPRETPAVTLLLPLAHAAHAAGLPSDGVVSLDLGPDTATTEIVLPAPAEDPLPEVALLDPKLARVAEALDDLLVDAAAEQPVEATRETA